MQSVDFSGKKDRGLYRETWVCGCDDAPAPARRAGERVSRGRHEWGHQAEGLHRRPPADWGYCCRGGGLPVVSEGGGVVVPVVPEDD